MEELLGLMGRSGFLGGFLGAIAATLAVTALKTGILDVGTAASRESGLESDLPWLHGDGIGDDTAALQAMADGHKYVDRRDGKMYQQFGPVRLRSATYRISKAIRLSGVGRERAKTAQSAVRDQGG